MPLQFCDYWHAMSNFRFVQTNPVVIRPEDYTWSVGLRNLVRFQWGFRP
jgi:hypothetical protein